MGKSRDLTQFTRGQVNVLKSEGYSQRQIASRLHISKCAVQNAIRLGENSNRKNCGRPKKTTLREDRLLKAAVVRSPRASSARIAHDARLRGCDISSRTGDSS